MRTTAGFAYAQARLQARFGDRPDETVWLRLHGNGELGSYLQAARQTSLRQWVLGIDTSSGSYEIELALRLKFRSHIDEVAGWLPGRWPAVIGWIKCLLDLPALQHLLDGRHAADWMHSDPVLADYTDDNMLINLQAAHASDCSVLAQNWRQGDTLVDGWLQHWHGLRPGKLFMGREFEQGLRHIEGLLRAQLAPTQGTTTARLREQLAARLRSAFRRFRFQPATSFAYLALTALDLERLRGDLVQRALFSNACETNL